MALGGAAWRNETRAWRRAMLKTPRPNTPIYIYIYIYVLSHVKTNNKSPTKYFGLDSASCRAAKELSVDTNRASLRQLLAAQ